MNHPLVSVNIRTYNSDRTLEETLQSVVSQSYKNIEIVVSDRSSTDKSVKIAKKYGARVNYAQKLGDARYQNYRLSRGKYIFSLDSDQMLDVDVVQKCVALCQSDYDAVTIAEHSVVRYNTILEKLIAYDKWLIDQTRSIDPIFGAACPRFFKKSFLAKTQWPKALTIFDDAILYAKLLELGARVGYLHTSRIRHYEVASWVKLWKKFFRYGRGYKESLRELPLAVTTHSLPRSSYFTWRALSKPHYLVGLFILYGVKVCAATSGMMSSAIKQFFSNL